MPKKAAKRAAKKTDPASLGPSSLLSGLVDTLIAETGEGTAQRLGSDGLAIKIRGVIPTGCITIDKAIGRGGVPLGRLTIVHGSESSGKTTLALHLVAATQKMGGIVLYIDQEHKLDPDYARNLGVNVEDVIISQPGSLEKIFRIIEVTIGFAENVREETGKRIPVLIVLDSMNAALSKKSIESDYEDEPYAPEARVYSRALPKIIPTVSKEDIALVFISQVREKMGVRFGNKEKLAGGKAPPFYASLIVEVRRIMFAKRGEEKIGNQCEAYVRKNQIAPPFQKAKFNINWGTGIDKTKALIDYAEQKGVLKRTKQMYSMDGEKLGTMKTLRENKAALKSIRQALKKGKKKDGKNDRVKK